MLTSIEDQHLCSGTALLDAPNETNPLQGTLTRIRTPDAPVVVGGWGSCKSCNCRGYDNCGKPDKCECGHHFRQHRD